MMAGLLFARAGCTRAGLREACGFLPRFPGRHGPSVDDGDPRPTWDAPALPEAAAQQGRQCGAAHRRPRVGDRRPFASPYAGAVHRHDAAMGIPRLPARSRRRRSPASTCEMETPVARLHRGAGQGGRRSPSGRKRVAGAAYHRCGRADPRWLAAASARRPGRADGRVLVSRGEEGREVAACVAMSSAGDCSC